MPTVKAKCNCYISGVYHEKGEVFEYEGPANSCVVPYVEPRPEPQAEVPAPSASRQWWNPMSWFGSGDNA